MADIVHTVGVNDAPFRRGIEGVEARARRHAAVMERVGRSALTAVGGGRAAGVLGGFGRGGLVAAGAIASVMALNRAEEAYAQTLEGGTQAIERRRAAMQSLWAEVGRMASDAGLGLARLLGIDDGPDEVDAATAALEKRTTAARAYADVVRDLNVQSARAGGDETLARILEADGQRQASFQRFEDMFARGELTTEQVRALRDRTEQVFAAQREDIYGDARDEQTEKAREERAAVEQAARAREQLQLALRQREADVLRAQGREDEADALQRLLAYERQRADILETQGLSVEDQVAMLERLDELYAQGEAAALAASGRPSPAGSVAAGLGGTSLLGQVFGPGPASAGGGAAQETARNTGEMARTLRVIQQRLQSGLPGVMVA